MRRILLLTIAILLSASIDNYAQKVEVTVTGVKSSKGQLQVYLFKDQKGFKDDKPYKVLVCTKKNYSKGKVSFSLDLSEGVHGISLIDDENSNKKMDYNLIKMPKEGFGFSDYYHSGLSMPHFDDFKFSIAKDETRKVVVKLRYM